MPISPSLTLTPTRTTPAPIPNQHPYPYPPSPPSQGRPSSSAGTYAHADIAPLAITGMSGPLGQAARGSFSNVDRVTPPSRGVSINNPAAGQGGGRSSSQGGRPLAVERERGESGRHLEAGGTEAGSKFEHGG